MSRFPRKTEDFLQRRERIKAVDNTSYLAKVSGKVENFFLLQAQVELLLSIVHF